MGYVYGYIGMGGGMEGMCGAGCVGIGGCRGGDGGMAGARVAAWGCVRQRKGGVIPTPTPHSQTQRCPQAELPRLGAGHQQEDGPIRARKVL